MYIDRTKEIQNIKFAPDEVQDKYWNSRVESAKTLLDECGDSADNVQKSLYELLKLSVEHEQYRFPKESFSEVERVVKFRINLPRDLIEDWYDIETISLYGVGLFTLMKGIMLDPYQRQMTNFDTVVQKGVYYDLSLIPSEVIKEYDFNMAVPAMGGLFVPKKTRFSNAVKYRTHFQYFDIML